jgi:hypothetical protein
MSGSEINQRKMRQEIEALVSQYDVPVEMVMAAQKFSQESGMPIVKAIFRQELLNVIYGSKASNDIRVAFNVLVQTLFEVAMAATKSPVDAKGRIVEALDLYLGLYEARRAVPISK